MQVRGFLAWLSFPILMGGFVALAAWGFARGLDPAGFGAALTVANFFVILAVEQVLPRNPQMNVFRDRQSLNDMGHGILLAALARPIGGALSVAGLAWLAQLRGAIGPRQPVAGRLAVRRAGRARTRGLDLHGLLDPPQPAHVRPALVVPRRASRHAADAHPEVGAAPLRRGDLQRRAEADSAAPARRAAGGDGLHRALDRLRREPGPLEHRPAVPGVGALLRADRAAPQPAPRARPPSPGQQLLGLDARSGTCSSAPSAIRTAARWVRSGSRGAPCRRASSPRSCSRSARSSPSRRRGSTRAGRS